MYITNRKELFKSVVEFYEKPDLWKDVLGSGAIYFIHSKKGNEHYFAMSKFCVLKDVSVETYISDYRYITEGNNAQKKIVKAIGDSWISRTKIDVEIRNAFDNWMKSFYPNYNVTKAKFISIVADKEYKREKKISPEKLEEILALQREIGIVGESIAFEHECNRLKKIGVKKPEEFVTQVSKKNSAAGYDIISTFKKQERFIEVKSTTKKFNEFYISQNEIEILQSHNDKAFLYIVEISDLKLKIGKVDKEIRNPVSKLNLTAVLYKADIKV